MNKLFDSTLKTVIIRTYGQNSFAIQLSLKL